MRSTAMVIGLCFLFAAASASQIEDTTQEFVPGSHYQEDGGQPGDAPDTCEDVDLSRGFAPLGDQGTGLLVENDDPSDAYAYITNQSMVGERVSISLEVSTGLQNVEIKMDVLDSTCTQSVLDINTTYYAFNQSLLPPKDPITPGHNESLVVLTPEDLGYNGTRGADGDDDGDGNQDDADDDDARTGWICKDDQWRLKLKSDSSQSRWPAQIYMEWTDGSYEYVDVWKTSSLYADFVTEDNLQYTLNKIVYAAPQGLDAPSLFFKGPCDAQQGTLPTPPQHPVTSEGYIEFTIPEEDDFVFLVSISKGSAEHTMEEADGLLDETGQTAEDPFAPRPMSCDFSTCRAYEGSLDYTALFSQA